MIFCMCLVIISKGSGFDERLNRCFACESNTPTLFLRLLR